MDSCFAGGRDDFLAVFFFLSPSDSEESDELLELDELDSDELGELDGLDELDELDEAGLDDESDGESDESDESDEDELDESDEDELGDADPLGACFLNCAPLDSAFLGSAFLDASEESESESESELEEELESESDELEDALALFAPGFGRSGLASGLGESESDESEESELLLLLLLSLLLQSVDRLLNQQVCGKKHKVVDAHLSSQLSASLPDGCSFAFSAFFSLPLRVPELSSFISTSSLSVVAGVSSSLSLLSSSLSFPLSSSSAAAVLTPDFSQAISASFRDGGFGSADDLSNLRVAISVSKRRAVDSSPASRRNEPTRSNRRGSTLGGCGEIAFFLVFFFPFPFSFLSLVIW